MKLSKKMISKIIVVSVATISIVIVFAYAFRWKNQQLTADVKSNKSSITLSDGKEMKEIKSGTKISGMYKAVDHQALFYTITDTKQQIVGSGSIMPKDGGFSRNIDLQKKPVEADSKVKLRIYSQDDKGAVIDQLEIEATYHE